MSGALIGDYYPSASLGLRLSLGVVLNADRLRGSGQGNVIGTMAGQTVYNSSESVTDSIKLGSVAPYLGVGYVKHLTQHLMFAVDLGVMVIGRPSFSLSSSAPLSDSDSASSSLRSNVAEFQRHFDIPVYPVLKFGFGWQF